MLREHQKKVFRFSLKKERSLNLSEVGTGKTLSALTLIGYLKYPALILCPAYLKHNWMSEIQKFFKDKMDAYILDKRKNFNTALEHKVVIASYSQLPWIEKLFKRHILVVDEAHYLKELKSNRSRFFHHYVNKHKPRYITMLTGTPILKHVPDLYPLLCVANPNGFLNSFPNFWKFSKHFTEERVYKIGSFTKREWYGVRNKDELLEILKSCAIRVSIDSLGELPEYLEETLEVDPQKYCIKKLDELWDLFQSYRENPRNDEIFVTKKAFLALQKTNFTIKLAKDLLDIGEQVVIFTDHIEAADYIHEKIESSALIKGGVSVLDRKNIVDRFQAGDIKAVVGTIKAMGTGINLTAARICIFNDLSWVAAENEQASARIRRIGQKKTCIKYFVVSGEIDARISYILRNKNRLISQVVKGKEYGGGNTNGT